MCRRSVHIIAFDLLPARLPTQSPSKICRNVLLIVFHYIIVALLQLPVLVMIRRCEDFIQFISYLENILFEQERH